MKQCAILVLLILLCVVPCLGEEPEIRYSIGEKTPPVVKQSVDLWVDATGPWSLQGQGAAGIRFLDHSGTIVGQGQLVVGNGPGQSSHMLEAHFDLDKLRLGQQNLHMQLVLEGAQGILGLPLNLHTWILPLNNPQVRVERGEAEVFSVNSGQWFLLEPGDRVFSREQEVLFTEMTVKASGVSAEEVHSDLWWGSHPLNLDAGEWATVQLHLRGPSPAGTLLLHSNPYLRFGENWSLLGQALHCSGGPAGPLIIQMPALPAGIHTLTGFVQALLPPAGVQGQLEAFWESREALRQVTIGRRWFDHRGQRILVDASTSLILPSGQIQSADVVSVKGDRLDVLVPWEEPRQPIWTGLPLSESVVWPVAHAENGVLPDFLLPVFFWDQGFSWRLLSRSGPCFFDLSPERQRFTIEGEGGSTRLEIVPSEHKATLSSTWQGTARAGSWLWRENADSRIGTYSRDKWRFTLGLPRTSDQPPSLAVHYGDEDFAIRINSQDVALRFSSAQWTWGARLNPPTVWVESLERSARYEVNSRGLCAFYPLGDDGEVKLQWNIGQNVQVDLQVEPWEAYLNMRRQDLSEGGLRYKQISAKGRLLSLVKAGLQLKNQLVLLEASGELGYVLASWCTFYLEGSLGGTISPQESLAQVDLGYGGGVIVKPLPQIVIAAGWNNREEWYVRAGVVIPFVGRKTQGDFE